MKNGIIIDCFAGGGGASVGIEMALGRQVDIAVNHDPDAILMHRTNHPDTLHLTEDIFRADLQGCVKGRHVALMWASPDCTSHSKAKGSQPRKSGLRILPWAVYKHAKVILPDVIIMENVEEIQQWGPLDAAGHPIPERKGEDYKKFITAMKSLGYIFDSRELAAADYGAPTTRKRWYAVFRRDGRDIVWPEPTHSKGGVNGLKPWEPIYKYLDLQDLGRSIFGRKKPLAENTMKRIARGLEKFVFNCPEPFLIQVGHGTASPMLIQYHSETTENGVRGQRVTVPVQTIDTSNRYGLVMPYMTKFYKSSTGQSLKEPVHTITTSPGHFGLVSVLTVDWKGLQAAGIDGETAQKCTWVSQFLMEYYGCGTGQSLKKPLHTIVAKDRFALVTVLGDRYVLLDIFLRMLKPEELKLAQGFPEDYIIDRDYNGNKYPAGKQVARIGNSVVPAMAKKLAEANCGYLKVGERQPVWQIKNAVEEEDGQMRFA